MFPRNNPGAQRAVQVIVSLSRWCLKHRKDWIYGRIVVCWPHRPSE